VSSEKPTPPRAAQWLLHTFLRPELSEEVTGDLEEKYLLELKSSSRFRANIHYWYEVLAYVRPFAIRRLKGSHLNPYPMYRSYFITAFRSMVKNKLHSFINIAGLSVGMAVAILIALWLQDEMSFERNFENYDRIAQVVQNVTNNGETDTWRSVPYPLAEELRKNYGGNFKYVSLISDEERLLSFGDKNLSRPGVFAEPDFTELFSLNMVKGRRDAIKDQSSILISESTAKVYFGDADPIGAVMLFDHHITVHVAGVYQDIPVQSELTNVHFVAAWDLLYNETEWIRTMADPWRPNAFTLYVGIQDHTSFAAVSENIKDAKLKRVSKALAKKKPAVFLFPMKNWHLYSEYKNGKQAGGRIQYVWLFGIVGIFVVLMACINFMNLSTARSEKRAKEVGIRKAIGSLRGQLVTQFFSESILISVISLVLALLLVQISFPLFNQLSDKQLRLPWSNLAMWCFGFSFCIVIGLIAGSYPAVYLSSIKAGSVLKGVFSAGRGASLPRKVLVILQFTVSVVLIIGTAVVFQQIQFAKNRPVGYETIGLVSVPLMSPEIQTHFDAIKTELTSAGAITEMAKSDAPTTENWSSSSVFDWDGKDPDLSVDFITGSVSHDYGKTIGWEIMEGRDFSREFVSDSSAFIINESAMRYLQLQNPIGATIRWYNSPFKIIGVVKDIIVRSPYEPVRPMFYNLSRGDGNFALFRINPRSSAKDAIAKIEAVFKKYGPGEPFSYQFTDQSYAKKFGDEERVGKIAGIFTSLAIFISCLGIFGLSSFVAEQRTKEIGVRKVMGASIFDLWRLISKDFLVLVIISCLIAIPISYQLLSGWLNRYDYHINIPLWLFVAASAGALVITMITVSWHTLHAANSNPIKSLRTE
jgi:putative ABC transport system permease protein